MTSDPAGFLTPPVEDESVVALQQGDVSSIGFVMNLTQVWSQLPEAHRQWMAVQTTAAEAAGLTFRQRGILVVATASTTRDSYCSLAWSHKLHAGDAADSDELAGVLLGDDTALDAREQALAGWARRVAGDPSATVTEDLRPLRNAGFDEREIFAITLFVGLRIAFSAINSALGVRPDAELADIPESVRAAVTYGRPLARCM